MGMSTATVITRPDRPFDPPLAEGDPCRLLEPRDPDGHGARAGVDLRATLSVALLADLIHNFGDALTAIPLGLAFFLRSARGERLRRARRRAGDLRQRLRRARPDDLRFIHPQHATHLWWLAAAGVDRLRRQRDRRADPPPRRPPAAKPGAGRRRQPRPRRRLRQPRRHRERGPRRARRADRRPDHRPGDHARHPAITWESWHTVRHAEIQLDHIDDHYHHHHL